MEPTRIAKEDVLYRMETGTPLAIVDARAPDAWALSEMEIPGSIRVPPDDVERHLDEIPRDRPVVIYCSDPQERYSVQVAVALLERGWPNVHPLAHGFHDWWKESYPTTWKRGYDPLHLKAQGA
ncbi:MAG: rhodanese-like domain-containing protein [Gemmatimonadota bacterium]|nr:rhodanese-like domain-containing protein [Gemmatimonadota bacterium]